MSKQQIKSKSQGKIKITSNLLESSQKLPSNTIQEQGQFNKYSKNSKLLMDQLILKRAYEDELPIKNDLLKQDFKQLQNASNKGNQLDLFCFVDPKSVLYQPIEAMRSVLIDNYTDEDDDSNIFSDDEHNDENQAKTKDIKNFSQKMNSYMKSVETQYAKYKNEQITMDTIQTIQEFYQKAMNGFLLELYKYSSEFKKLGQRIYRGLELSFQCLLRHHAQECNLQQGQLKKQQDKINYLKQKYNYLRNDVDEINTLVPKVHLLLENLKNQEKDNKQVVNFSSQLEYLTKKEEYMLNIFENEKKQLALTKIERMLEIRNNNIIGNKKKEISKSVEKFQPSNVQVDLKAILSSIAQVTQNSNDLIFDKEEEVEQQRQLDQQARIMRHDWKSERVLKINQVKTKLVDKMVPKLIKPQMKDRFTSTQEDFVPIKNYILLQEILEEKKKQLEKNEFLFQVKDETITRLKKEKDEILNKLEFNQLLYQNLKLFNKTKKFYITVMKKEYEEVLEALIQSGLKYAEIIQEQTTQVTKINDDSLIQSVMFNQKVKTEEFTEQLLNSQKLIKKSLDEMEKLKKQQQSKFSRQSQISSISPKMKQQQKSSNSKIGSWKDQEIKEESSEFDSQESFDQDKQYLLKSKQGSSNAEQLTQNKEFQKLKQRYSVIPTILKDQVQKLSMQMESEKNMKSIYIEDHMKLKKKKRIHILNRSNSQDFNHSEFESPIKLQRERKRQKVIEIEQTKQNDIIQKRKILHSQISPNKKYEFEYQDSQKAQKSPEKNYSTEPFNINKRDQTFEEAQLIIIQQAQSDIKKESIHLIRIKEEESSIESAESQIRIPRQISQSSSDTMNDSEYFETNLNEVKKNTSSVGIQKSLYLNDLQTHISLKTHRKINEEKETKQTQTQTEIINCKCEETKNQINSAQKKQKELREQRQLMNKHRKIQSQDLISHLQYILTNNENFKKEMLTIGFTKYLSDNRIHQTRTILQLLLKKLNIDYQSEVKVPSPPDFSLGPWVHPQPSNDEDQSNLVKSNDKIQAPKPEPSKDVQVTYPYLKHQVAQQEVPRKSLGQNQNLPVVQKKRVNEITQKLGEFYAQHLRAQKQKIESIQKAQQEEIKKEEFMKVNPIVTSFTPFKGDLLNKEQSEKYDPQNLHVLANSDIKQSMGKTDSFIKLQKIQYNPLPNMKHESEIILKKEQAKYPQQFRLDRRQMLQSQSSRNFSLSFYQGDSLSYTKQKLLQEYKQALKDCDSKISKNAQQKDILTYRDKKKSIQDFENQIDKDSKSYSREGKRLDYQFFEEHT